MIDSKARSQKPEQTLWNLEQRLPVPPDDSSHRWIVRRDVDFDGVPGDDPDHPALAHLSRRASRYFMAGFQLHTERGIRQCLHDNTLRPEIIVLACDEILQSSANNRFHPNRGRHEPHHRTLGGYVFGSSEGSRAEISGPPVAFRDAQQDHFAILAAPPGWGLARITLVPG